MKLSLSQKSALRELANRGPLKRSCTNSTMCTLEKRGLARWDMVPSEHVPGHKVETWFITDEGRKALS